MIYFDIQHPDTGEKWKNIANDPRDRYDAYTNGKDIYINIYEERNRAKDFLMRIVKQQKAHRAPLVETLERLNNYPINGRAKVARAVERSKQNFIKDIERSRHISAQIFRAAISIK